MSQQTSPLNRVTLRKMRHHMDQAIESRAAAQGAVDLFFRLTTQGPMPETGPDAALISSEDLASLRDGMSFTLHETTEHLDAVDNLLKTLELDEKTPDPLRSNRQTETA